MKTLDVSVNVGKEIFEISSDFANPIEVVRESLHNSYDAGATRVDIRALPQTLPDGRRVLTLEFVDNGIGMDEATLERFFGLGYSDKPTVPGRRSIGLKGHGTKIYYQAKDLLVATRVKESPLRVAKLSDARTVVNQRNIPRPEFHEGDDAERIVQLHDIPAIRGSGTVVRLVDFTPDSSRLIDAFRMRALENYLRWFTIYGSFEHVVRGESPQAPFSLHVQATDATQGQLVSFGHAWPSEDQSDLKQLKKLDDRRPFNYFRKTLPFLDRAIEDGYRIDVAVLFEGKRGRLERDTCISRQRVGGLYTEEERYGLWLCRDFIPIERKFEWLLEDECPKIVEDLRRPLVLVNSQDFMLIANRGSVGNSSQQLLSAIKQAVFQVLEEAQEDKDIERFLNEYQEDLFSRQREKDQKALIRRIDRFNVKQKCRIQLADGRQHEFFEPQREITLFGLISELQILDADMLGIEVLDYDDHVGIDLLVRKNGNPGDLLDRTKVAYVELKYILQATLNHAFDHLSAIICWDCDLQPGALVTDAANNTFHFEQQKGKDGVTSSALLPPLDSKLAHNVKVIVLKRLLEERNHMTMQRNPKPVSKASKS